MSQIESYLKRVADQSNMSFEDDLYSLYDFIPNTNLQKLLATYHTQLNRWFAVLNEDIRTSYDADGNIIYSGGYFHAQDSRDYLALIEAINQLRSRLSGSEYAFSICNDAYVDRIKRCRSFVVKSGGSSIPDGFPIIELEELTPIFQLSREIKISRDADVIYTNLKSEGEGSYARVFSYIDPLYHIPIAVKRAHPNLDSKELERFKQEFDTLKSLKSPYIVDVYYYDSQKNEYTMEYMDETIHSYITRNNESLTLAERKNIISQVCRGLKYIHSKALLHRDISLTNVFIKHFDDVDVVKIGDFGLVKVPESNLTSLQSEIKGSLNDSDLINVGFSNYDMWHETYALTRLCFFILTGRTNVDRQKDGAVKQLWIKGTNPDKTKRFQTVDELLAFVQQITNEDGAWRTGKTKRI